MTFCKEIEDPMKLKILLLIWALISLALGIGFTFIPWGDPQGFHGTGFPFASVYWDYIDGATHPTDYPNPYAPFLNVGAFLIVGLILIMPSWLLISCLRRRSHSALSKPQRKKKQNKSEMATPRKPSDQIELPPGAPFL